MECMEFLRRLACRLFGIRSKGCATDPVEVVREEASSMVLHDRDGDSLPSDDPREDEIGDSPDDEPETEDIEPD